MHFEASPGMEIAGYRVISKVGRGGTATVWLADHPGLGRRVALKLLAADLASDPAFRARFSQEAHIAAALEHPNVLPVYDAGEFEGLLFIAMRYVDGRDLASVLEIEGALSFPRTIFLLAQVAAALDAAHARGLVHRDVKPANVLVDPGAGPGGQDHVYLADFGLAKPTLGISELTAAGELYGTVNYMAPEQLSGGVVDARSDVYSFACVAYECLTGLPPFRRETLLATAYAQVHEAPTPPTRQRPGLPSEIDDVLLRGLSKDKSLRFRSAGEMLMELSPSGRDRRGTASREGGPSPPPFDAGTSVEVPRLGRKRLRRPWLLVAAGALVAVIVITGSLLTREEQPPPAVGTTNLVLIDGRSADLTKSVSDGNERLTWPGSLWFSGPTLWQATDQLLVQREAATGEVRSTHPIPPSWKQAVGGLGSIWVTTIEGENGIVHRIDPISGLTLDTAKVSGDPVDLAIGPDAVWAMTDDRSLARIDPITGHVDTNVRIPGTQPNLIVAVGRYVWIGDDAALKAYQYDAVLGRVTKTVDLRLGEFLMDVANPRSGTVWIVDPSNGTLTPIDSVTGERGEVIGVAGRIWDAKVAGTTLWVAGGDVVTEVTLASIPEHHVVPMPAGTIAGTLAVDDSGQHVWIQNCDCPTD